MDDPGKAGADESSGRGRAGIARCGQAIRRRPAHHSGAPQRQSPGATRPGDRVDRAGRRGQDDADAAGGGIAGARRGPDQRAGFRRDARIAGGAGPGRLHAAALRTLRRPLGPGKPRPLRGFAGRAARGARGPLRGTDAHDRAGAVHGAAGRAVVRRHETEAGPRLHAGAAAANCCCWTSRRSVWTPCRGANSGRSFIAWCNRKA